MPFFFFFFRDVGDVPETGVVGACAGDAGVAAAVAVAVVVAGGAACGTTLGGMLFGGILFAFGAVMAERQSLDE